MSSNDTPGFVHVNGNGFILDGRPYRFIGTNLWYGMNLASKGPGGDRGRLTRELDMLQSMGVSNIRVMAGTEGPESSPWRVVPALQPEPRTYNDDLLDGLDFLLCESGKRNMKAVLCLTNFWEWSGGLSQYLAWHGCGPVPFPNELGEWRTFQRYTARFFSHRESIECLNDHIRHMVSRVNRYTGIPYRDDPAIFSWQLCNEPRGVNNKKNFNRWINETARLIKSMDSSHMVSTGTEGETPFRNAGLDFIKNNSSPHIDYMTAHIWVQNWGIYRPERHNKTFNRSISFAVKYIEDHIRKAYRPGKPVVFEEFGFPRDNCLYAPGSPTSYRDIFYEAIFSKIASEMSAGRAATGANFWAWSGTGVPAEPQGSYWRPGMSLIGDPPHEKQGWYGVYSGDTTIEVIKKYAAAVLSQ